MRWWSRKWHVTIYKRLILAFIAATLPIYLLAGLLFNYGTSVLRQDIVDLAQTQLVNYTRELNNAFKRFNTQEYVIMNGDFLTKLARAYDVQDPYRNIELINIIRAQLISFQSSSDMIADVRVYLPLLNIEISSVTGYGTMDAASVEQDVTRSPYKVIEEKGKLLMVAYPLDNQQAGLPGLLVVIELQERVIQQNLEMALSRAYTGAVVLGLSEEHNIISVNNSKLQEWVDAHYSLGAPQVRATVEDMEINGEDYIRVRFSDSDSGLFVDHFLDKRTMFAPVAKHFQWFWIFFIVTFVAVALYLVYINQNINKPLIHIVQAFRRVEDGRLDISIKHDKDDEFGYLYVRFNEMLTKIKSLIDEVYNQQIHRQNAELKQLQSQINPHFLYNCLFSIIRLIKLDKHKQAVQFTDQLARYFHFITRSGRDEVPLEQEVQHTRNYAELQLVRFSDRISMTFEDIPGSIREIPVPRLILQPLVENAFVHGLEDVSEGGLLRISFRVALHTCMIVVEDNGETSEDSIARMNKMLQSDSNKEENKEITAIFNVHRRLRYKYGDGSGIRVERSELGGVKVSIIMGWKGVSPDVPDADRG